MSKATASTRRFLKIAVLTISDSRCFQTDSSGSWLQEAIENDGHELVDRKIVVDDIYQMRAIVSSWIAEDDIEVVITTGGTGFTGRDSTPEALAPIFDKHIEGFGELFRQLSYDEIGTSTVQSRCLAGLANRTAIFCLPGSTGACKTGWNGIIKSQLDSTFEPCNFVQHVGSEVK
ncbi:MAG: molybdenum cofactor biosynthesis protein B [Porticoccaceae bacterium]|jgi:molybdenum cofactor biosynthesis protein B|nr:molybdenum cofactor biosynthesis protein B [Porticoccaceae bacterium]MBT3798558.1 molybdenum cofactor biosynthesis protein B [Porticoccaceae bacterium]MBT5004220.1 molybdenum cofactor biosynthesis protein B [Porticoccaceae bacterium]MBT6027443.1 molybdenum cofactor biosynthesis protein B [Porticoccaceae bacterium]MBT7167270.1 molybdenum cofactor biosynthesis protein B [Porticoccaceae bacterium]